jgi:arylamine N-acetyltransferase
MKTAEQIAEKLWEKYRGRFCVEHDNFLAALREYGAEVRNEALDEACTVVYGQCDNDNVAQRTVEAIRRMKI